VTTSPAAGDEKAHRYASTTGVRWWTRSAPQGRRHDCRSTSIFRGDAIRDLRRDHDACNASGPEAIPPAMKRCRKVSYNAEGLGIRWYVFGAQATLGQSDLRPLYRRLRNVK
jgi:hypothetical protein